MSSFNRRAPRTPLGLWVTSVVLLTVSLLRRMIDRVLMSLPAARERKGTGLPSSLPPALRLFARNSSLSMVGGSTRR